MYLEELWYYSWTSWVAQWEKYLDVNKVQISDKIIT